MQQDKNTNTREINRFIFNIDSSSDHDSDEEEANQKIKLEQLKNVKTTRNPTKESIVKKEIEQQYELQSQQSLPEISEADKQEQNDTIQGDVSSTSSPANFMFKRYKNSQNKGDENSFQNQPGHQIIREIQQIQYIQESSAISQYSFISEEKTVNFGLGDSGIRSGLKISKNKTMDVSQLANIMNPNNIGVQVGQIIAEKIANLEQPERIRNFLMTPIAKGNIFQYEVHKFKKFLKTQYFLSIQYGERLKYIAYAVSDTISLQRTTYTLSLKVQNTLLPQNQGKYEEQKFIGILVSDFKRQTYILYDHKNYSNPQENDKIICTVVYLPNYTDSQLHRQELYIPNLADNKSLIIYNNSLTSNLKKLYKNHDFTSQISKYTSHSFPEQCIEMLKDTQQFKIVEKTTRNAIVRDQTKRLKFFIVKMQNNRFKIRATAGITPIQLFCYAIVHLQ